MLELTDVTKTYEGFRFGPVDLAVGTEVLSVLGPSGSGKTTLLSLIAGIAAPDRGSITLQGRSLAGRSLRERRTGLVFQDGALFPHMTARENIGYAATDDERVAELAALLEIDDVLDRRPPTLSGGERQRVALARTLAAEPETLLLDEPLSSLDAPIRRRLRGELRPLFESLDIPVVYVTHDQRTATALGDRMAIFRDGTIEQLGSPTEVLTRPESRFVAEFTGTENLLKGTVTDATGRSTAVRVGDRTLRVTGAEPHEGAVTVCVHPSRVSLSRADGDGPGVEPSAGRTGRPANVLFGTVDRWLNEGDEYRVGIDVEDAPVRLVATVSPTVFDRLDVEAGTRVRTSVPGDAIHLLARPASATSWENA
jgi:molybdate/tungstate transport system ATP-binding protein